MGLPKLPKLPPAYSFVPHTARLPHLRHSALHGMPEMAETPVGLQLRPANSGSGHSGSFRGSVEGGVWMRNAGFLSESSETGCASLRRGRRSSRHGGFSSRSSENTDSGRA